MGDDIWKSLYEFPVYEAPWELGDGEMIREVLRMIGAEGSDIHIRKISDPIKHQLTHRNIFARFVHVEVRGREFNAEEKWEKVAFGELGKYPLPRLIDRYFLSLQLNK